jgi:preprotein translocase subunit YajC
MLATLQSGDEVVTTGGIYGVITNVKDDRFVVRVGDNTKIEVGKAFILSVTKKPAAEEKKSS